MCTTSFPFPATSPEAYKNHQQVIALWQILSDRFDEEELRTLCFYLGLDYDDLPATGKTHKARELLIFLNRRSAIDSLISAGQFLRPDIDWNTVASQFMDEAKQPASTHQPVPVTEPFNLLAQTMRTLAHALSVCREQTGEPIAPQPYALYHCEGNTIVAVVALA